MSEIVREGVMKLRGACQHFVDRVESGEVRSTKSYGTFKEVLADTRNLLTKISPTEDLLINQTAIIHADWVSRMGWDNKSDLECLALICSEVGEAINEVRGPEPTPKLKLELADIVLRVMGFCVQRNIDLAQAIREKMTFNMVDNNSRGRLV